MATSSRYLDLCNWCQVQYAFEAVNRGSCTVGIRGKDCVILAVEKKQVAKLQDSRTVKKILQIDEHISLTFSGLQADARVLANMARLECQSYRFQMEDEPTVDYITRFIAKTQQKYTQQGGMRPFGISTLVMGFGDDKKPKLYQTEPSGSFSLWKAACIGRNSKSVREFLEKSYQEDMDFDTSVRLAIESLLEVVESEKNIEISFMMGDRKTKFMSAEEVDKVVEEVKKKNENK